MGFYISQYLFSGFIIKQIGIKSVLFFSLREGSVEYSKDNYKMLQSICLKGKCIKKVCSHNLYEHTFLHMKQSRPTKSTIRTIRRRWRRAVIRLFLRIFIRIC